MDYREIYLIFPSLSLSLSVCSLPINGAKLNLLSNIARYRRYSEDAAEREYRSDIDRTRAVRPGDKPRREKKSARRETRRLRNRIALSLSLSPLHLTHHRVFTARVWLHADTFTLRNFIHGG